MRSTLVFPGQGAQQVGMGADVHERSSRAREVFRQADQAAGKALGKVCFEGPEELLRRTEVAQPSIMTTSLALLAAALERHGDAWAKEVAFVAGHSLGQFTALVVAGALDFADALQLVCERGRLMGLAGEAVPSGMAALLGIGEKELEALCDATGVQVANYNSPGQVVIAGPAQALAQACQAAPRYGAKRVVPLNVSGAFHSRVMAPAAAELANLVGKLTFRAAKIPLVSNVSAEPLTSAEEIRQDLIRQLLSPVQWQRSVERMVAAGVTNFIEVGPGSVLSGLIKRVNGGARTIALNSWAAIDAFDPKAWC